MLKILKANTTIDYFIKDKMKEVDSSKYTDLDFYIYSSMPHCSFLGLNDNGEILAFFTAYKIKGVYDCVYTWCEKSIRGKRAYIKMLRYFYKEVPGCKVFKKDLDTNLIKKLFKES